LIKDATGGAIMCWRDDRTTETASYPEYLYDIYAQRVDTSGNILWEANGVPVSTATNGQLSPKIIPIDCGGAILSWSDSRNTNYDIYAQRLNANGTITNMQTSKILPEKFKLYQNYPNPFNPSTRINWQLPVGSWVTLKVYDMLGREVTTLVDEFKEAGYHDVEFRIPNSELASGVYFYQLKAESADGVFIQTKKFVLIK
jgi:hypothetical protein